MIGYLTRLAPIVVRAKLKEDGALVSRIHQRVRPSEIDINLHMNQAVYPRIFELGRTDWFIRSGMWEQWRGMGFNPMVAQQTLTYRRELKPLRRYSVDTRVVGIDGRFLQMESWILVGDRAHTRAEVRVLFVGPEGVLSPEQIERIGRPTVVEPLEVVDWTVRG